MLPLNPLDSSKVNITAVSQKSEPSPKEKLKFGRTFTDHMLTVEWSAEHGWAIPEIKPFTYLSLNPSANVLQYAFAVFEGMKAYRTADDQVVLFRPEKNMERMNNSANRICLPSFDSEELIKLIGKLIELDKHLIPAGVGYSLYLRPTMISTSSGLGVGVPNKALLYVFASPVGPYFNSGLTAIRLEATDYATRAWPGGVGDKKVAGNYAPCVLPQSEAAAKGFQQNLWLFGRDKYITEVGTMNVFFVFLNKSTGRKELVTPPLDGTILPGITRDTVLSLARANLLPHEWDVSERYFTINEVAERAQKKEVLEAFGTGTAAVVVPIGQIGWDGAILDIPVHEEMQVGLLTKTISEWISDAQYCKVKIDNWSRVVADMQT